MWIFEVERSTFNPDLLQGEDLPLIWATTVLAARVKEMEEESLPSLTLPASCSQEQTCSFTGIPASSGF